MDSNWWLVPIKSQSWDIITQHEVYGVPCGRKNELEQISVGDYLMFYIFPPVRGIVGACKVTSDMFINSKNYWGGNKYQCRLRLKVISKYVLGKEKSIPLYEIVGYKDDEKEFTIEPFLHNVLFVKLNQSQVKTFLKHV